jgi:hypothetical protein
VQLRVEAQVQEVLWQMNLDPKRMFLDYSPWPAQVVYANHEDWCVHHIPSPPKLTWPIEDMVDQEVLCKVYHVKLQKCRYPHLIYQPYTLLGLDRDVYVGIFSITRWYGWEPNTRTVAILKDHNGITEWWYAPD